MPVLPSSLIRTPVTKNILWVPPNTGPPILEKVQQTLDELNPDLKLLPRLRPGGLTELPTICPQDIVNLKTFLNAAVGILVVTEKSQPNNITFVKVSELNSVLSSSSDVKNFPHIAKLIKKP